MISLLFAFSILATHLLGVVPDRCLAIRKHREWRELDYAQKSSYLEALKCLRRLPPQAVRDDQVTTLVEELANLHAKVSDRIQFTQEFLPYHRAFLAIHDKALKDRCGYTGPMPYWDWAFDNPKPERSEIWKAFGRVKSGCVIMPIVGNLVSHFPEDHCVARDWLDGLISPAYSEAEIRMILQKKDFKSFSLAIEKLPNFKIHELVGGLTGDMSLMDWSVNDPIFFLHHRNMDRLWAKWQKENPTIGFTYGLSGGMSSILESPSALDRIDFSVYGKAPPILELLNTTGGGMDGGMCYEYSNSITTRSIPPQSHRRIPNARSPISKKGPYRFKKRELPFPKLVSKRPSNFVTFNSVLPVKEISAKFLKRVNISTTVINDIKKNEKVLSGFNAWLSSNDFDFPNAPSYPFTFTAYQKTIPESSPKGEKSKAPEAKADSESTSSKTSENGQAVPYREKTDEEVISDDKFLDSLIKQYGKQL